MMRPRRRSRQALEQVKRQRYRGDVEVVVVDDSPEDQREDIEALQLGRQSQACSSRELGRTALHGGCACSWPVALAFYTSVGFSPQARCQSSHQLHLPAGADEPRAKRTGNSRGVAAVAWHLGLLGRPRVCVCVCA